MAEWSLQVIVVVVVVVVT